MEDKKRFIIKEMRYHELCGEWAYDTEDEAVNQLSCLIDDYDAGECYIRVIEDGVDISELDWTRCNELYDKAREIINERYMKSFRHAGNPMISSLESMLDTYSEEEFTSSAFLKYADDFEDLYKKIKDLKDLVLHIPESERDAWLKREIKNRGIYERLL